MENSPAPEYPLSEKCTRALLLVLIVAGLAGNYFKYPIFLNIDFLFGSIFAMLALQFCGLSRGVLAAAAIASYTFILWNHPYAIIIMTVEVAVVGWLSQRRKVGLVLADMLYWLIIGMPLVYIFYHVVMHVPASNTYIIMTKQAVNGICNALIARLIFTGLTLRNRSSLISYREAIYNLLTSFVLFPAIAILMVSSRADFAETDLAMKNTLLVNIEHESLLLNSLEKNRASARNGLAEKASTRSPLEMQPSPEHIKEVLDRSMRVSKTLYSLLDSTGSVIITNRPDQKVMTPFNRGKGNSYQLDERISQWIPVLPANTPMSERWKKSLYIAETQIGSSGEWKLILEQPVAPFQQALFEKYANRLGLLLILLIGALTLAEIMSRRIVITLEKLSQITCHLPAQIMNSAKIDWPESRILEVNTQIENFKETATALRQQFAEIQKNNISLEERVEERTKALLASEEKHRSILMTALDGFWVVSSSGRLLEVNESYCRMSGYSEAELLQMSIADIDSQEDPEGVALHIEKILTEGEDRFESVHRKKDGTLFPVEVSVQYKDKSSRNMVVFLRDITRSKQAEQEMLKLSNAVDQSPVSIVITDTNGFIEFANPKFSQITGYSLEEVLGQTPRILKTGHTSPEKYQQLWETISAGDIWEGEFLNKKKDGSLFWESATIAPIMNPAGVITNYVAIKEDITAQKQLEEQLRHAQKMEAVGQLAGGVAHDFNNILQVIMTSATLMKMNRHLDAQDSGHAEQILASAQRAATLTRDLLAFSRRQTINLKSCDLNSIVENIRKFLIRIIGEDLELQIDCCATPLIVNVDSGQIDQVLVNLATNARDAMPGGGRLSIKTELTVLDESFIQANGYGIQGSYACLIISDSGIGMDESLQKRIFEPFFTTKGIGKGTGLGLSIVYGIVKSHKGFIHVTSEPGAGTTFSIYLPNTKDEPQPPALPLEPSLQKGTETILVVEDEEAVQWSMNAVLSQCGYTVIQARSGKEGVEQFIAHRDKIKLIIMDVIMPVMDGREAAQQIRQLCPGCRLLFASGYTADFINERSSLAEGEEFISKPVQPLELLGKIREILDRK